MAKVFVLLGPEAGSAPGDPSSHWRLEREPGDSGEGAPNNVAGSPGLPLSALWESVAMRALVLAPWDLRI